MSFKQIINAMKQVNLMFLLAFFVFSCSSKLDLDQAKQLDIQPVIEADILYFDLHKENLTDANGLFRQQVSDTVALDIFDDGKVRDGFLKAEITVGFRNTFFRQFDTDILFIDENNQPVETAILTIPAAGNGQDEISGETVFVFDRINNPDFINFRKIVVQVTVTPQTLPVEDESLHVQVKGKFYTNIRIE